MAKNPAILVLKTAFSLMNYIPEAGKNMEPAIAVKAREVETPKVIVKHIDKPAPSGTGCVPCSADHLSTIVASLNEAMRFARGGGGIEHPEVQRRIELAIDEANALERLDAAPDALLKLPPNEKAIMDEMLPKLRKIRQRLGEVTSVEELEQIAAEAHTVRMDFKMRHSGINPKMLERVKSLAQDINDKKITKEQAISKLKEDLILSKVEV